MKPMQEVCPFPLTAELFDAMFENEAFRARLKAHWEEVAAEKKTEAEAHSLENARLHGTESLLQYEFLSRPNASKEEIAKRRAELHAEFDKRFR